MNTPLVTYCDGPDARVAREGSTTSTSAQAETPATIITKQIRQPIGIRIEGQVLEHFHFMTAKCGEARLFFDEKPRSILLIYTKSENALAWNCGSALKMQMLHDCCTVVNDEE